MMRTMAAAALTLALGCGGGGDDPADASTVPDAAAQGTITFDWSLATPASDPLTCSDVAAASVRITATPAIGGFAVVDAFTCTEGTGTTRGLDPGAYNLAFRLTATNGTLAEDVVMNGVTVTAGGNNDIGAVAFEVEPTGAIHFTVSAGAPNCDLVGDGGAGITALEIELVDDSDVCIPTDFCVGDDLGTAGCEGTTYSNDCAGATTPCVDDTVVISTTGALSGPHHLQTSGHRDLELCFSRDSQITIPGGNLDRDLGSQALAQVCDIDAGA